MNSLYKPGCFGCLLSYIKASDVRFKLFYEGIAGFKIVKKLLQNTPHDLADFFHKRTYLISCFFNKLTAIVLSSTLSRPTQVDHCSTTRVLVTRPYSSLATSSSCFTQNHNLHFSKFLVGSDFEYIPRIVPSFSLG